MKFGENLYALRKSTKMSQEDLAEKVGVSRQSVSKWENGEAYPEMDNILKICKIFHCKINDLIHDDIQDIASLDEEIKMKVVKFEKEKQKKLKRISNVIYDISMVGSICAKLGAICLIIIVVLLTVFAGTTSIKNENEITTNLGIEVIEFKKVDNEVQISGDSRLKVLDDMGPDEFDMIANVLKNNSKVKLIPVIIFSGIFFTAGLFLLGIALKHLADLFNNINKGDTPFTLENVYHIKQMSYFMIAVTITSGIANAIVGVITERDFNFGVDLISALVFYSIAYIFEYGYELQLDSKAKIYGDEDENN
ncbi:MAG: helix-turn-helix domain-containing protein [Clostridia bacterium]|nr:helix-turn-helix domain-containing protein [Clostridia bacterium]